MTTPKKNGTVEPRQELFGQKNKHRPKPPMLRLHVFNFGGCSMLRGMCNTPQFTLHLDCLQKAWIETKIKCINIKKNNNARRGDLETLN